MIEDELRLECLRLALPGGPPLSKTTEEAALRTAQAFADFVLNNSISPDSTQAQPAMSESEADPRNPNVPGHEVSGYISPPTT